MLIERARTLFSALAAVAVATASSSPLLGSLQADGLAAPLAAAARPSFSWRVGGAQTAYRLRVRQLYPFPSGLLWDSGLVASNSSWLVPFGGAAPLPADADIEWSVDATVAGVGLLSASALLSTAPAAPPPGAWLGFADTLRGAVSLGAAPVLRARVRATGVGCYQLTVNGQLLSAPLAPGFGHAASARALFDTYDVARVVRPGQENVVGLRLGSCKWGDAAFVQYCRGSPAQCNAGFASLVVDQGGNVTTLATGDASGWLAANTSVLYQHLWNGELTDARLEQRGWDMPAFANASAWAPATIVETADLIGPLTPTTAPPVDPGALLTPASVTALPNGAHVFDLGANIAGYCGLDLAPPPGEAPAPAGAVLSLLHAELLFANGSIYNHFLPPGGTHQPNGLNQPQMNYTYITRGGDSDEMMMGPRFSFFGFRFVELRGWPFSAAPAPAALQCRFIHTLLPPTGAVAFPASAQLDALQIGVVRTHLSNYVTVPTDCPQREKRGWTGDGQLTAHSGMLNFDALAFYRSWHQSILDQQRIGCLPPGEAPGRVGGRAGAPIRPFNWACDAPLSQVPNLTLAQYQFGPVSDVVPREQLGMGYFVGDPSWEVVATTLPYELLTQLADLDYVSANFDGPESTIAFFNALGEADPASQGLITWSYLGDWVALDVPNNKLVANVNYVMAAQQAAEVASAIGRNADATKFLALAALLSDSAREKFWNVSAQHWDRGSQSAQALCLAFGVGGASVAAPAAAALLAGLDATDGHLTVGASGARVLLSVLHDVIGRPDVALALALKQDFPSWGIMFANASNTTYAPGTYWESWVMSDVASGSSLNHIFKAGGISPYLYELALGLRFSMRPAAAAASDPEAAPCDAAAAAACPAHLGLRLDPTVRFGLGCAHVTALCGVVAEARAARAAGSGAGVTSLARLAAAVAARVPSDAVARGAGLEARIALTVSAAAASMLGEARGWRQTPAGNISFAWRALPLSAQGGPGLDVELVAPAGANAETLLELPLSLRARVSSSAGAEGGLDVEVDARALRVESASAASAAWAPRVLRCAGAAAARVEGAAAAAGPLDGSPCEPVLLLRVPPGRHAVTLRAVVTVE
jgi:alpha-L-rhamnosidase